MPEKELDTEDLDVEELSEEELRELAVIDGRRYRTISAGKNATNRRP